MLSTTMTFFLSQSGRSRLRPHLLQWRYLKGEVIFFQKWELCYNCGLLIFLCCNTESDPWLYTSTKAKIHSLNIPTVKRYLHHTLFFFASLSTYVLRLQNKLPVSAWLKERCLKQVFRRGRRINLSTNIYIYIYVCVCII